MEEARLLGEVEGECGIRTDFRLLGERVIGVTDIDETGVRDKGDPLDNEYALGGLRLLPTCLFSKEDVLEQSFMRFFRSALLRRFDRLDLRRSIRPRFNSNLMIISFVSVVVFFVIAGL